MTRKQIIDVTKFFYEIGTLRKIARTHRQTLLTDDLSDNIASHTFRVCIIGMILAQLEKADISKTERIILDAVNKKIEIIKINPYYGNNVPKRLIPDKYKIEYSIRNLYRIELPLFWRMLYTLTNEDEIRIIAFILDVIDHRDYNKKFGYKNR